MKLTVHPSFGGKKISPKHFILSHLFILIIGLLFLFGLYYILNVQYQDSNNPFSNGPVSSLPKSLRLDLDQPADDTLIYQSSIIISGKTAPLVDVLIFTDTADLILKSKPDGSFSTVLNLEEGINKVVAVTFDVTGDWRSIERSVYYSKEKI